MANQITMEADSLKSNDYDFLKAMNDGAIFQTTIDEENVISLPENDENTNQSFILDSSFHNFLTTLTTIEDEKWILENLTQIEFFNNCLKQKKFEKHLGEVYEPNQLLTWELFTEKEILPFNSKTFFKSFTFSKFLTNLIYRKKVEICWEVLPHYFTADFINLLQNLIIFTGDITWYQDHAEEILQFDDAARNHRFAVIQEIMSVKQFLQTHHLPLDARLKTIIDNITKQYCKIVQEFIAANLLFDKDDAIKYLFNKGLFNHALSLFMAEPGTTGNIDLLPERFSTAQLRRGDLSCRFNNNGLSREVKYCSLLKGNYSNTKICNNNEKSLELYIGDILLVKFTGQEFPFTVSFGPERRESKAPLMAFDSRTQKLFHKKAPKRKSTEDFGVDNINKLNVLQ